MLIMYMYMYIYMNFLDTQIFARTNAAIISDSQLGESSKLYMIDMNNEMSIAIPTLPILYNVKHLLRTRRMIFWSEGFTIKAFSLEDLETRMVYSNEGKGMTVVSMLCLCADAISFLDMS